MESSRIGAASNAILAAVLAVGCQIVSADDANWTRVSDSDFEVSLRHAVTQIEANLNEMTSWRADFVVHYREEFQTESFDATYSGDFVLDGTTGWYRVAGRQKKHANADFRLLSKGELGLSVQFPTTMKWGPMKNDPNVEGWSALNSRIAENLPMRLRANHGLYSEVLDPMRLYKQSPYPFRDELTRYADESTEAVRYLKLFVRENSIGQEFRLVSESASVNRETHWEFSSGNSFHLHKYEMRDTQDDIPLASINIHYQMINGVVIPVHFKEQRFTTGGLVQFEYDVTLLDTRVNEVLPEDEFSLTRFGLRTGDRVREYEKTEVVFVVDGDELITPDAFEIRYRNAWNMAPDGEPAQTWRIYLIAANMVFFLVIGVSAVTIRLRRSGAGKAG